MRAVSAMLALSLLVGPTLALFALEGQLVGSDDLALDRPLEQASVAPRAQPGDRVTDAKRPGRVDPAATDDQGEAAQGKSGTVDSASCLRVTVRRAGKPCPAVLQLRRFRAAKGPDVFWPWHATVPLPAVVRETPCDADGRARFAAVAPGDYVILACTSTDTAWQWCRVEARESMTIPFDLDRGPHALRGRVVLGNRPFRGWVHLEKRRRFGVPGQVPRRTDPEGRFAFDGLRGEPVWLVAIQEDGLIARSARIDPARMHEVVFDVLAGATEATGVVVERPGRIPVPGAVVRVQHPSRCLTGIVVTADAEGKFRLPVDFETEEFDGLDAFEVTAPGLALGAVQWDRAARRLVVWLEKECTVIGRVVRRGGRSVAGARVWGAPIGECEVDWERAKSVLSGGDGAYRLEGLPPGEVLVVVHGNGWASIGLRSLDCAEFTPWILSLRAGSRAARDIEVEPTGRVAGRVCDAAGRPLVGVRVRGDAGDEIWHEHCPESTTDAAGRFAVRDMPAGPASVSVRSERCWAEASVAIRSGATAMAELRSSPRPSKRAIAIRVVDTEGNPIRAALVSEDQAGSGRADSNGQLVLSTYTETGLEVFVEAEDALDLAKVPIPDGAKQATIVVPRGVVLSGTARFADGRPAAGIWVSADPSDAEARPKWVAPKQMTSVAMDGRFALRVANTPHSVEARICDATGERWARVSNVDPGARVDLVFPARDEEDESERTRIRIVGPGGDPVSRAYVYLESEGGDGSGPCFDDEIPGGGLDVDISHRCHRWTYVVHSAIGHDGRPLGAAQGAIARSRFSAPVIRLPEPQSIAGVVRDESGAGIPGCTLEAHVVLPDDEFAWRSVKVQGRARTDAAGRFRIGGLGDGRYEVVVRIAPRDALLPDPFVVAAPARDLAVRLERGTTSRLTFIDWRNRPVPGVTVSAVDNTDRHPDGHLEAQSDETGVAVLKGLNPRRSYRLRAHARRRTDLFPHGVRDWRPGSGTIGLERAYAVEGRVVNQVGKAIAGASVWIRMGTRWQRHGTNRHGAFCIGQLRAGPVRLRVSLSVEDACDVVDAEREVMAGVSDLVFKLPGSRPVTIKVAATPGDGAMAWGRITWARPDGTRGVVRGHCWRGGVLKFPDLRHDREYDIWIQSGDRFLYRKGHVFRRPVLPVTLQPGKSIRGRLSATRPIPAGTEASVGCELGPLDVCGEVDASGAFEITGLPDGIWTVRGAVEIEGVKYTATARVRAGADCTLELAPARD